MKNPFTSPKPNKPQMSRADRARALRKNLILGIPAILISLLCLALLFNLARAIHTANNQTLNTDTSLVVQDGDNISIDFTGTVQDKDYQGGTLTGQNEQVLIGSGSYIGDFEQQLIGHHVGETVDVTITYPEDYSDDTLRSKEAVFATTINGIYQ